MSPDLKDFIDRNRVDAIKSVVDDATDRAQKLTNMPREQVVEMFRHVLGGDEMGLLDVIDGRTVEQLLADDCHRWPQGNDGARVLYVPPHYQGRDRRRFICASLLTEPEGGHEAEALRTNFIRAGGDVVCPQCGEKYYDHPQDPRDTFLNIICDRTRVKL